MVTNIGGFLGGKNFRFYVYFFVVPSTPQEDRTSWRKLSDFISLPYCFFDIFIRTASSSPSCSASSSSSSNPSPPIESNDLRFSSMRKLLLLRILLSELFFAPPILMLPALRKELPPSFRSGSGAPDWYSFFHKLVKTLMGNATMSKLKMMHPAPIISPQVDVGTMSP